jgi:drug/metabolite transporter (DMT)-like permease
MARIGARARSMSSMASVGRRIRAGNPVVLAALGAASISASAVLVRLADTGAATTAFYRCLLALPLLAVLGVIEQAKLGARKPSARLGAFLAGLFLAVDLVVWTHAIYDVGAGVATVLGNLQVLFVALIAWAALGEAPGSRFLLALLVVIPGVVLVAGLAGHAGGGFHPLAGVLYGLATSITYAAFIIILRRSTPAAAHVAGPLADATLGAVVGSLLIGLAFGSLQFTPSWAALGWLLVLAVTSQTVGWLLITSSLPRLPAALSSLLLLLQPAAALVLAAVVLAQRPTWLQIAGAALVCSGVLIAARTRPTAPADRLTEGAGSSQ